MKNLVNLQKSAIATLKNTFLVLIGYLIAWFLFAQNIMPYAFLFLIGAIMIIEIIIILTIFLAINKSK